MGSRRALAALLAVAAALLAACGGSSGTGPPPPPPPPPPAAAPTFSPEAPLHFRDALEVALATTTSGGTIRYTTDGTDPTASSSTYAGPFTITTTTVVRAYATGEGARDSAVAAATYTYRPVDLVLDDGTAELLGGETSGARTQIMANRFTPAPEDFPFQLRRIRVVVDHRGSPPLQLAVYADPDGIPTDATLLDAFPLSTIAGGIRWTEYELAPPLRLAGPGDVIIGVVGTGIFLLGQDTTAVAGRTLQGWWQPGSTRIPAFPPEDSLSVVRRNLMLRGSN